MTLFSIILLLTGIALTVIGILLYKGRTSLVHSYHRAYVRDHAGYGKAMGVASLALAAFLLAGVVASLLWSYAEGMAAVAAGFLVYAVLVIRAQRRYNSYKAT